MKKKTSKENKTNIGKVFFHKGGQEISHTKEPYFYILLGEADFYNIALAYDSEFGEIREIFLDTVESNIKYGTVVEINV